MKKVYHILISILWLSNTSFSQESKSDSLLNVIKTSSVDTTKVNAFNSLFLEYEFEDIDKAGEYLTQGFELAKKINFQKGLAKSYMFKGYFDEDKSNFSSALKNNQEALSIFTKLGDKQGIAGINNSLGSNYQSLGKYPEALKYYFSTLKIYLETGNKRGEASTYSNIGTIYLNQSNYSEALKNINFSLKIYKEIGDKSGQARCYLSVGNVYATQNDFKVALKNYLISQKLNEELGNKIDLANLRINIGLIYQLDGNYDDALKCYAQSMEFFEEIENKSGIAVCYGNLGEANIGLKNYAEARKYLNKAIELSKQIGNKECIKNAYIAYFQMDSITGNYKGAFENHKNFVLYRDSLNNEETRNQILQNQMTFDFEKKEAIANTEHKKELENQKSLSEERSRKQKAIIIFVIVGLFLVIIFSAFVFRSLQTTRKQKNIIEEQKIIVEEKQHAIIDSIFYARRIQQSLLPTEKYIERSIDRLKKK